MAASLFYNHDEHTIGVDTICEQANVSKRTLYKHFSSKEVLVSAALSARANMWAEEFMDATIEDPAARIKHVFRVLERNAGSATFHGCPMMNTSIELRDSDVSAYRMAQDFKGQLYRFFKEQATLLKIKDADAVAEQLVVLYDGCNAWIVMRRAFPGSAFMMLDMLLCRAE